LRHRERLPRIAARAFRCACARHASATAPVASSGTPYVSLWRVAIHAYICTGSIAP
jgi:hypothetical protein